MIKDKGATNLDNKGKSNNAAKEPQRSSKGAAKEQQRIGRVDRVDGLDS